MFDDICEAILAAQPVSFEEARQWMSTLTGFLHDVAPTNATDLWKYLTDVTISSWVSQGVKQGRSLHTLNSRRGVLSWLLSARRGITVGRATQNRRGPSSAPLSRLEAQELLRACESDSRSALRGYVAHIAAAVPKGSRKVRFTTTEMGFVLANESTSWPITPIDVDLAELAGDFLIDEDWIAVKGAARDLGILLNESVALQTFRSLAVADDTLTLVERFRSYGLNEVAITAAYDHSDAPNEEDWASHATLLRNGRPRGECATKDSSTSSPRSSQGAAKGGNQKVSRTTSRAATKRLAQQRAAEASDRALRAKPVDNYLTSFVPDNDDAAWDAIAPVVRSAVTLCAFTSIETARKHAVALTAFLRWRLMNGQTTTPSEALTFAAIDAFFVHGMPDLSERSRRDYRARLRAIAKRVNSSVAAPPSLKLGYNRVNPGYAPEEEVTLRRVALKQSNPEIRCRLCAIVGLCAGAGLSSAELRTLRRSDVSIGDDGVMVVNVRGPRPHQTAVRRAYERHVHVALEGLTPEQLVLPELKSTSPINVILKGADLLETAPAIDTRRLRTTWICWLMTQRIPLRLALEASGLQSARTFYDMLQYIPSDGGVQELRDGGAK